MDEERGGSARKVQLGERRDGEMDRRARQSNGQSINNKAADDRGPRAAFKGAKISSDEIEAFCLVLLAVRPDDGAGNKPAGAPDAIAQATKMETY